MFWVFVWPMTCCLQELWRVSVFVKVKTVISKLSDSFLFDTVFSCHVLILFVLTSCLVCHTAISCSDLRYHWGQDVKHGWVCLKAWFEGPILWKTRFFCFFSLVSTYISWSSLSLPTPKNKWLLHGLCSPPTGKTALLQAVQIQLLLLRNKRRDVHRPTSSAWW